MDYVERQAEQHLRTALDAFRVVVLHGARARLTPVVRRS